MARVFIHSLGGIAVFNAAAPPTRRVEFHARRTETHMSSLGESQARFFLEHIALPWLKNEHPVTKRIIEAIPSDKGDYRPDPISRTAFELAWHIAAAENRFLDAVASGEFDFSGTRPDWVRNSADVAKWYAENFEANIKRLEKLSDQQLLKIVDFRGIRQWPAVLYL